MIGLPFGSTEDYSTMFSSSLSSALSKIYKIFQHEIGEMYDKNVLKPKKVFDYESVKAGTKAIRQFKIDKEKFLSELLSYRAILLPSLGKEDARKFNTAYMHLVNAYETLGVIYASGTPLTTRHVNEIVFNMLHPYVNFDIKNPIDVVRFYNLVKIIGKHERSLSMGEPLSENILRKYIKEIIFGVY